MRSPTSTKALLILAATVASNFPTRLSMQRSSTDPRLPAEAWPGPHFLDCCDTFLPLRQQSVHGDVTRKTGSCTNATKPLPLCVLSRVYGKVLHVGP